MTSDDTGKGGDVFRCGHPRTPENSTPVGNGFMRCRECHNQRSRELERTKAQARKDAGKWGKPYDPHQYPCGHPRTTENRTSSGECRECNRIRNRNRYRQQHPRCKPRKPTS